MSDETTSTAPESTETSEPTAGQPASVASATESDAPTSSAPAVAPTAESPGAQDTSTGAGAASPEASESPVEEVKSAVTAFTTAPDVTQITAATEKMLAAGVKAVQDANGNLTDIPEEALTAYQEGAIVWAHAAGALSDLKTETGEIYEAVITAAKNIIKRFRNAL